MPGYQANIPIASTGRLDVVFNILTGLLIAFAAALVLIEAGAMYGIMPDDPDFLVLTFG